MASVLFGVSSEMNLFRKKDDEIAKTETTSSCQLDSIRFNSIHPGSSHRENNKSTLRSTQTSHLISSRLVSLCPSVDFPHSKGQSINPFRLLFSGVTVRFIVLAFAFAFASKSEPPLPAFPFSRRTNKEGRNAMPNHPRGMTICRHPFISSPLGYDGAISERRNICGERISAWHLIRTHENPSPPDISAYR